jgi:sugar phosphate isomerase/epimerase
VATLDAVADRVVHVHVKDVVGDRCVPLGEGDVNILGCLRVLEKHHYAGVVSLETEGDLDVEQTQRLIETSRTYLVRALG